jgi:translation elongation factor EF-Tu-like GTPase
MNCPTCKNPILNSSSDCEWCGASLNLAEEYKGQHFVVTSTFNITGRGTVYVGDFEGKIKLGDIINLKLNGNQQSGEVKMIEHNKKLINSYEGKGILGLMIKLN